MYASYISQHVVISVMGAFSSSDPAHNRVILPSSAYTKHPGDAVPDPPNVWQSKAFWKIGEKGELLLIPSVRRPPHRHRAIFADKFASGQSGLWYYLTKYSAGQRWDQSGLRHSWLDCANRSVVRSGLVRGDGKVLVDEHDDPTHLPQPEPHPHCAIVTDDGFLEGITRDGYDFRAVVDRHN